MNGVLVTDKPAGWTSHDVVAAVKRRLGARKVGHLGTLDPISTGVLPLVIDGATKCARFLDGGRKEYLAAMRLGQETDTYDREGAVISAAPFDAITEDAVKEALSAFHGRISQIPPMYSSIKKGGVPLYKLARKGVVVEREPREIEIFSIEAVSVALPVVSFRVACSKGTYVRSICHDAGRSLGCGAHLTELRRLACGPFNVDGAISPDAPLEALKDRIIPIEEALKMVSSADSIGLIDSKRAGECAC